jgi:uncharacterized protein (TIGR03066 family)
MKTLSIFSIGVLVCFVGLGRAEDKPDYAKLIVGKWVAEKADDGTIPAGTEVEFTKDLKLKITVKEGGQETKLDGSYKIEGDKFIATVKVGDDEHMNTITMTKIDDKVMLTKDKDGKVVEFKRAK